MEKIRDIWEVLRGRLSSADKRKREFEVWMLRGKVRVHDERANTAEERARKGALADMTTGRARQESDAIADKVIADLKAGFGWCPYCNRSTQHSDGVCVRCLDGIRVMDR